MRLSRVVVKNLRALTNVDIRLSERMSLIIGENNAGKSCLVHALRLCLDVNLPSSFRSLLKEDVNSSVDQSQPYQVFVGVEFADFEGRENEEALLHGTQIGGNRARIFYRFRPKRVVREALAGGLVRPLTLDDFGWELFGGGNPTVDLTQIDWNTENRDINATLVGLQYLQNYLVAYLPPLRDVEADLQVPRRSPLMRLIEASNIGVDEQNRLIDAVTRANREIESSTTIRQISSDIDAAFEGITGPAFRLGVDLGLSSPTFQAILRNLIVLLSNASLQHFEPRHNGLGLNNILYIAILIEHFRKRAAAGKSAGELILVEEPEAHLHPQLQSTLISALRELPFQVIATTHSTQVTSKAALSSFVILTNVGQDQTEAATTVNAPSITSADKMDLERYLDATKANLLFARRVMLVEGAAELLLLPVLIKKVLGIDLEREGISIVSINGVHFGPFTRLFTPNFIRKKCAVVADADIPADEIEDGDDPTVPSDLRTLEGPLVRVFVGGTTFEREITQNGNLPMLAAAAGDLGAPRLRQALEFQELLLDEVPDSLKDQVLRAAKRFGKARFAQVAARHVALAGDIPSYVSNAVSWLREP